MTDNITPFWIPCSVRFPEPDVRILAVLDEGDDVETEIITAKYVKFYEDIEEDDEDRTGWYDDNEFWYPDECITHWMPLPILPSKQSKVQN